MKMSLFQSKRFVLTLTLTMCCVAFSVLILGLAIAFNKAPNNKSASAQYIYGNNSIVKLEVIDDITLEDDTIEKLQPKIQVTSTGKQGEFGALVKVTSQNVIFDYTLDNQKHTFATIGKGVTINTGSSMVGRASSMTIQNKSRLETFRDNVNNGVDDCSGTIVKLSADINLKNEEWAPIGTQANPFKGTFDGQNHTISGLKISKTSVLPIGLFSTADNATIKNVNITSSTINCSTFYAGFLLGQGAKTNIENCNVDNSCSITLKGVNVVGGICGLLDGNILKCSSDPTITITESDVLNVGGVVGAGSLTIENCCSKANIIYSETNKASYDLGMKIGGIVGFFEGSINKCLFNGSIEISTKSVVSQLLVAGIAGCLGYNSDTMKCAVSIKNCVVNLSQISVSNENLQSKNIKKHIVAEGYEDDYQIKNFNKKLHADNLLHTVETKKINNQDKKYHKYYYESNTGGTGAMVYPIHAGCYYTTERIWYIYWVVFNEKHTQNGIDVAMKNGKYWITINTHAESGDTSGENDDYSLDKLITVDNVISNNYYTGSSTSLSSDWKQYATMLPN